MKTRLIETSDLAQVVSEIGIDALLDRLIDTLATGFASLQPGQAPAPPRTGLHYQQPDLGLLEWMPALSASEASLKMVGYHPTNPAQRGLPSILSSICLFETDSGHLKGIMDGTFLTALRTGAMSALATRLLAAPRQSAVLGIIGCGSQAVTQAHALSRIAPIGRILACDINPKVALSFAARLSFLDISVQIVPHEKMDTLPPQADILCTCTSEAPGRGPLFADFQDRSGLHINAVGSDFPQKFELPLALLKRAKVVPDFREQARAEGECQQLEESDIGPDLATLLRQPSLCEPWREQLTVFDSTGHAYADFLAAKLLFSCAESMNLGREIEVESVPSDPLNPYCFLQHKSAQPTTSDTAPSPLSPPHGL